MCCAQVISNLVRAQAVVGTGAAIREGRLPCSVVTARLFRMCASTKISACTAGLNVLGDDQGMEVVGKLVAAQAVLFAKVSMDPLARQAAREAAKEAVTGSYVSACHRAC